MWTSRLRPPQHGRGATEAIGLVDSLPLDADSATLRSPQRLAGGSTFYAAMRVLPRAQRQAMFAIYGFCRAVDNIADGDGSRDERLRELACWRAEIVALYGGTPTARVCALADPMRRFELQRDDLLSIIDGVEMDVRADIVAPDASTLDVYCDRVACAVGRLSIRVFRMPGPDGIRLASELGRALQLTNILRDLDEDAARGRLYLPREALLDAGIDASSADAALAHPALDRTCRTVAARARAHFAEADKILSKYPLRITVTPLLMANAYRHILDRLVEQGWAPPRRRVTVGRLRVLWMLAQHEFRR